jgi:acyl-coenzyme A synthetase/AMP-(fatty) acid ligase
MQLLLPSSHASAGAQAHLLEASKCAVFLYVESMKNGVENVVSLAHNPKPSLVQIPGLSYWFEGPVAPRSFFNKTWEQAKSDPWLVFHTSGTTGRPMVTE